MTADELETRDGLSVGGRAEAASTSPSTAADIHELLRGHITSGLLGAEERLPSIRQLARDFGVANGTVAKAYASLEQEGLVVTRTSAGTRVAPGAAPLPEAVVQHIRELVALGVDQGAALDDVVAALRASWASTS